jgi:hypothetical protein
VANPDAARPSRFARVGFDIAAELTCAISSFVIGMAPFKDETKAVADGAYTAALVPEVVVEVVVDGEVDTGDDATTFWADGTDGTGTCIGAE